MWEKELHHLCHPTAFCCVSGSRPQDVAMAPLILIILWLAGGGERKREKTFQFYAKWNFLFFWLPARLMKKNFFLNQHYELKRLSRNICTVKLLTPKKSNIVFILYKLKWKIKTHLGQCAKSPKQEKSTSEVNPFSKRWH